MWQPAGCVSCEPVCVCVSLVRVVIICPASTHTALVSSPSLAVLHLSTYLPNADREKRNSRPAHTLSFIFMPPVLSVARTGALGVSAFACE